MKKSISIFLLLIILSCHSKPKQYLTSEIYSRIVKLYPASKDKPILVYYFDGDCSLCIAKVRYINYVFLKNKNLYPVFIAKTLNPDILKYNLKSVNLISPVYIDKENQFENKIKYNEVMQIYSDKSYEVLSIN